MVTFLTESKDFQETATVGGFQLGNEKNSFDAIFESAYSGLMGRNINPMLDITAMIRNRAIMEAYKDTLLGELRTECAGMNSEDDGAHVTLYEQVSDMFDNCVNDFISESTRVPQLLPIKAIDFPVLVKQALSVATKDIMQTEVTKTPIIKKHLEQTYIVDNNDRTKRWRYPQCFFDDGFKEAYNAGKGFPIDTTPVPLSTVKNFNIITNLTTGADPTRDNITIDLKITKVLVTDAADATRKIEIMLDPPMRVKLDDNTWQGGKVETTVTDSAGDPQVVSDMLFGTVDFLKNTTSLVSQNGVITDVVFGGYISNELNERSVTFDYVREEREWKIEDGSRVDVPYSLEELEDAKALMDIDLYKKTYNNLADYLVQLEDSVTLSWLDEEFARYDGIEIADKLGFTGFTTERIFDCDSTSITTALPSEYIQKMLKFTIDRLITDICDSAKMDDMTFVIYGNPRYIQLLGSDVNWVTRPGSTANGVKLDYAYGIFTSGDVKVQVVSTKKVNAYYDKTNKVHYGLRLIPFPLSNEQFTFKHYKYTTHILTAQNSAYRNPQRPGGSMTNIFGVARYTNASVQAIQAKVGFSNLEPWVKV